MTPTVIFSLPHNRRDELYSPGEGPSFRDYEPGETRAPPPQDGDAWATLPIPMPRMLFTIVDGDGRVIAARADDLRIRWADLDIVTKGIKQYNSDLAALD